MRKVTGIIFCLMFLGAGLSQAWAADNDDKKPNGNTTQKKVEKKVEKKVQKKIVVKDKTPDGITIKNDKVTIKKGFMVKKVSKSKANLMSKANNNVTGSFDCTCNGSDGGCNITTTPTSVSCSKGSCKSSCYMIVTIPGTADRVSKAKHSGSVEVDVAIDDLR